MLRTDRPKIGLILTAIGLVLAMTAGWGGNPAAAQDGLDGWTVYELNMRAGPDVSYDVTAVVPVNTGLVFEARNQDISWLLGHTEDGTARGWVAAGYVRYQEGFAAVRLPVSDEVVGVPAAPAPAEAAPAQEDAAPAPPAASGLIASLELIHDSGHSEYYRLTYWSDGLLVNGYLGYPKGDGKFPAIIYNRGGHREQGALTGREIIPLVEAGYVAAASQYRGNAWSQGSESFGEGDVNDVLNLIGVLQQLPMVDTWRIGMMGCSRGGLVTYMALKEDSARGTHIIKAAVTVGGIADLFLWRDERGDVVENLYMPYIGVLPEQAPDLYKARSAVFWPQLINAPLLLLHGEDDGQVSVDQSRHLYDALYNSGHIVELITYPGGDHGLNDQIGGYPEALRWFQTYLTVPGDPDRSYWTNEDNIRSVGGWFLLHY
ncbi:MAG: prolyl oligopeptidase family serine peptidase [Anaerolineae bacterium]|nr:prolyl oligopeptidase family serine peptidase [Anaerolineae bacterium]